MTKAYSKKRGYGLDGLYNIFPEPIVSKRAPLATDKADLGTIWVDKVNDDAYILTSISSNSANWINSGGGSGHFATLTVTGDATFTAGDVDITAGGLTLAAGDVEVTLGTFIAPALAQTYTTPVCVNSAGEFVSDASGELNGYIIIGGVSGAIWATITAGPGIVVTNADQSITIEASGVTASSYTVDSGGPVVPAAGNTTIIGYDANITTDGNTANTIKIRLANNITSVGSITASTGFTVSSGSTSITSNSNTGNDIYLHANGGVNETIVIRADQGTGLDSINFISDVGGMLFESGVNDAAAIKFDSTTNDGGITLNAGLLGLTLATTNNGPYALTTGEGTISIGGDPHAKAINIGNATGATEMTLTTGTGDWQVTAGGKAIIDSVGDMEFNSSGGDLLFGNDPVAQNVSLATGAAAKVVTIGSTSGASSCTIDCGTSGVSVGASANAHSSVFGGTNTTSDTTIQSGTGAMTFTAGGIFDVNATGNLTIDSTGGTLGFGTGANAKNINIGTGAAERIITIGNNTTATSVVINVGTANLDLGVNATSHLTRLGSTSGTSGLTLQSGTSDFTITAGGDLPATIAGNLTETITGNRVATFATASLTSSADSAQAIYLHSNGGTTETIELENTQGTDAAAIKLTATAGGVNVTASTGIKLDADGALDIVGDTGTNAGSTLTLNKRVGVGTFTGLTTASGATQQFTITNSTVSATSGLIVTVANKSAGNDCMIQMQTCTPAAGSFTVDTKNVGSQDLDSDVVITWIIIN